MPFSIKRLTQMHRSSSLPSRKETPKKKETKNKMSQLPMSRSIDASEIRRVAGQITISNPIPIDPPPGSGTLPIRFKPRHEVARSGYCSDADDHRQQRRVLTLVRPVNGQQPMRLVQQHEGQNLVVLRTAPNNTAQSLQQQQPDVRAREELLINGCQRRAARDRRHHTIASNEHFSSIMNNSGRAMKGPTMGPQRVIPQRPSSTIPGQSLGPLFDDDPGIMSEIETSATGFRRSTKMRSSLPIVRTPSKTQERPLGLVFLQYRNETKRGLLPNEITSIDTVKALFVRSFPNQLTMQYLDHPNIFIYIHDHAKNMFYELEDLRDVRDRCVLKIYEHGVNGPQPVDTAAGYFSEPEFESRESFHKRPQNLGQSQYYGTVIVPQPPERAKPFPGYSQTLPRGVNLVALYGNSNAPDLIAKRPKETGPPPKPQRSMQRVPPPYPQSRPLPDRPYSVAGQYPSPDRMLNYQQDVSGYVSSPERRMDAGGMRSSYPGAAYPVEDPYYVRSGSVTPVIDEEARVRMQMMERQLASLTTVVQKVLTPKSDEATNKRQMFKEDRSVSFSEEMSSPLRGERIVKSAIKKDKPPPPPKPLSLIGYRVTDHLSNEMVTQLRQLRRKTKDLRQEVRSLRRMTQQQTSTARDTLRDTCNKISASLAFLSGSGDCQVGVQRLRVAHDRDAYGSDAHRLDKDLLQLESQVEELRSNVINRRCRVNMNDVETMAMVLSRASKTVADLKTRYPHISETLKMLMPKEMDWFVRDEKFLKEEPDRLEMALKRCKKLTGTLVTLKRLASVQEQRSTEKSNDEIKIHSWSSRATRFREKIDVWRGFSSMPPATQTQSFELEPHTVIHVTPELKQENVLDALLDELQAFSKPQQLKRAEKEEQPNPPPRSSSARINCPPLLPRYGSIRSNSEPPGLRPRSTPPMDGVGPSTSTTSLSSVGSVVENKLSSSRQELLELRHQELLKKQKQLQEQYTRLQQLSRGQIPRGILNDLKKTGSESNIVSKTTMAQFGSLTQLTRKNDVFETDII